jgi:colanic acid/amylovoran biosynthesis glycosyltransferase
MAPVMDDKSWIKRRVAIFRNEVLPVSETFIVAQANALRRYEPVFAGILPTVKSLSGIGEPLLLASSRSVVNRFRARLFWRFGWSQNLVGRLRRSRLSLIHAHFGWDGAAAVPLANSLDLPLVVTLHGYDVSSSDDVLNRSPEGRAYLRRRTELWGRTAIFFCISKFIRDCALAKGFPPAKLQVHYTGTDLAMFRHYEIERDRTMILFVGRFVEKKGCIHLLLALRLLIDQGHAAHVVMIGGGPLEDVLRRRVAEEGLPCEFVGVQPVAVVKSYMARARIFCVPSVTAATGDSEGLGMVFIEAQAMGTPVSSFDHGGISEAVVHGQTGLLAPEGDDQALANNLLCLLQDDFLWSRLSTAGITHVEKHFDISRQTRLLEDLYDEAVESYKQHPSAVLASRSASGRSNGFGWRSST